MSCAHRARATCAALSLALAGSASAFEIKPDARLHLDYGHHHADAEPLHDHLIARRATIGLKGKFTDDWSFEAGYELSSKGKLRPRDGEFKDVAVTYEGWSAGEITAGQFKVPFGLEELTSSNDTMFIERALPVDAFAPSRRLGVGFAHQRSNYTASAMAFGSSIDGGDRGRGLGARLTYAPVQSASTVVHLGLSAASEKPRGKVDIDTAPESRVADVDLVNTGSISDVNRIHRIGLEGAWRSGPFALQAEWMRANLQRGAGQPNAALDGWYLAGSWALTGETRPYKNGRFKAVEASKPSGAWELTARLSRINLDDGKVRGGRERNATLGLNYTYNKHVRVMLNHIWVRSERRGTHDNPRILLLRVQFAL